MLVSQRRCPPLLSRLPQPWHRLHACQAPRRSCARSAIHRGPRPGSVHASKLVLLVRRCGRRRGGRARCGSTGRGGGREVAAETTAAGSTHPSHGPRRRLACERTHSMARTQPAARPCNAARRHMPNQTRTWRPPPAKRCGLGRGDRARRARRLVAADGLGARRRQVRDKRRVQCVRFEPLHQLPGARRGLKRSSAAGRQASHGNRMATAWQAHRACGPSTRLMRLAWPPQHAACGSHGVPYALPASCPHLREQAVVRRRPRQLQRRAPQRRGAVRRAAVQAVAHAVLHQPGYQILRRRAGRACACRPGRGAGCLDHGGRAAAGGQLLNGRTLAGRAPSGPLPSGPPRAPRAHVRGRHPA